MLASIPYMQSVNTGSRATGKRPRPKAAKSVHKQARNKSEDEVQAFINGTGARGGPLIKADVELMRVGRSYIATWETMGKVSALVFPLWSTVISVEQYEELDQDYRCRCVRQPAEEGTSWLYVPLTHLDGVHGGLPCINQYLVNSVRLAQTGESASCRIMLDWEFNGYTPDGRVYEHRCVLVSTSKTKKGHEWRLGRAFAERWMRSPPRSLCPRGRMSQRVRDRSVRQVGFRSRRPRGTTSTRSAW